MRVHDIGGRSMWSKLLGYIPEGSVWFQAIVLVIVPVVILYVSRWLNDAIKRGSFKKSKPLNLEQTGGASPGSESEQDQHQETGRYANIKISGKYSTDIVSIRETVGRNADVYIREVTIKGTDIRIAAIFTEGLIDPTLFDQSLMAPLMTEGIPAEELERLAQADGPSLLESFLLNRLFVVSVYEETQSLQQFALGVLGGKTGLIVDGVPKAFIIGGPQGKTRSIDEPLSEALLRGPRIGFTEQLSDNTGILRRYGSDQSLLIEKYQVGTRVKKDLAIAYMQDIVDPKLVEEVRKRINAMEMDVMLESGYVEQLIEDSTFSPFQQVLNTERPDRVMGGLLEGRVAILLDGTPFVLVVPVTFSMLLQSPEDYYERWIPGTFLRMLRFLAAMLALLAPALYISFISFHPGLIPTKLVLTIIETRTGVPFPSIIEVLIMELSIEILREAGIRLPKPIGPAMGIVGGLIIGQAAVQAGIISQFLVIVVAVTAISSFTIPVYSAGLTLRILRFAAMFSAAVLGLFGVVMFFLLICTHLARLSSFGVPYVAPAVPYSLREWKDFIIRAPIRMMRLRPKLANPVDEDRTNKN